MKIIIYVCLLCLVGFAMAGTKVHSRGCVYALDRCIRECEEGTHSYTIGCDYKTPEPTCGEPNPAAEKALICDYSACYCDPPTVRDPNTNKCVQKEDCTLN